MESFTMHFDIPVSITSILDELAIEYLVVNDTRLIVIYQGAVIRIDTKTDDGEVASIQGRILESPQYQSRDLDALLTRFRNALNDATEHSAGTACHSKSNADPT